MEQEHIERTFEIDGVIAIVDHRQSDYHSGRYVMKDVEEVMYAEKFVIVTHRQGEGGPLTRRTFTYNHLVSLHVHMKPDMPLLGGVEETVQDEVVRQEDIPLSLNSLREAVSEMMED